MTKNKNRIPIKNIAIQAGITALAFAMVNRLFPPRKGMGVAMKTLAFLPLEHQARFADAVTGENVNNRKWLVEQFSNLNPEDPNLYRNLNRTSIGNAAYIALKSDDPESRDKSLRFLENIRKLSV